MDAPAPDRQRLFVAVDVPRAVARAVADAADGLRERTREARWTDPASWHLTLAFLGTVHTEQLPELRDALGAVAGGHAPVDLELTGQADMFGRRVLWAGLTNSLALGALAHDVRTALEPLGFPPDDRPFHPHLTLARARKGGALPRDLANGYAGPRSQWTVTTLDLMRSHLGRGGARYERLEAWPLEGDAKPA